MKGDEKGKREEEEVRVEVRGDEGREKKRGESRGTIKEGSN